MYATGPTFGAEAEWHALEAAQVEGASREELTRALDALQSLVEVAGRMAAAIEPDDLADLLMAAIRIESLSGETHPNVARPTVTTLWDRLDGLGDDAVWAVASASVVSRLGSFRHAHSLWLDRVRDLPPFVSLPGDVEESCEAYLESLAYLDAAAAVVDGAASRSRRAAELHAELVRARSQAATGLALPEIVGRLWPLADLSTKLGLHGVVRPLSLVLQGGGDGQLALVEPQSLDALTCQSPVLAECAGGRSAVVADIVRRAARGRLSRIDLDSLRRAMSAAPGVWATAHRAAVRNDGLPLGVWLVRSAGSWTAPSDFWTSPAECGRQLGPGPGPNGRPRLLSVPASAVALREAASGMVETPSRPETADLADRLLGHRRLHLAGADLFLFADAAGPWLRFEPEVGPVLSVRCDGGEKQPSGAKTMFPLIPLQHPERPSWWPRLFRPGLLRAGLARCGQGIDRAYGPVGYVVTVGESILRALLDWDQGRCGTNLSGAARAAGVDSGAVLLDLLSGADALGAHWVRALRLGKAAATLFAPQGDGGASDLGSVIDGGWGRFLPENLGAEFATIRNLPGLHGPVDGDSFTLVGTRTATSVLACQILGCCLAWHYPASTIHLVQTEAMIQRDAPGSDRDDIPDDAFERTRATVAGRVSSLLRGDATDVLLVISGGVKWVASAALLVGRDLAVPCVYQPDGGMAVVFRWDLSQPPDSARQPAESADPDRTGPAPGPPVAGPRADVSPPGPAPMSLPRWLVVSVGTGLLAGFRRAHGLARNAAVDSAALAEWVLAKPDKEQWQVCAELTGVEAWKRSHLPGAGRGDIAVALVATASPDGRACAEALVAVLKQRGCEARHHREWDVMDFTVGLQASTLAATRMVFADAIRPLVRVLGEIERVAARPVVLAAGGQKMTSALLQLIGNTRGCEVFLALEPDKNLKDPQPRLLKVPTSAPAACEIERVVGGLSRLAETPGDSGWTAAAQGT